MFLTEDKLIDWVEEKNGLLITRRTININNFNYDISTNILYVCITGYKRIIEDFFNNIINKLKNIKKIILIIVESDIFDIKKEWLDITILKYIYCWNKPYHHAKLKCIPIGLNYNRQFDVINKWINSNNIKNIQSKKNKLLCMNCSLYTSPERVVLNNIVKNKWNNFCDILPFVNNLSQHYIPSHIEGKILIKVTNPKCYDDWKPYKFILSPQGTGLDCHRTWEALMCGIIPIVKTSMIDELYSQLPIVVIKDWNEINEKMLNNKYIEIMKKWNNNEYNMNKLNLDYWTNIIDETNNISSKPNIHFITYGNKKYEISKKRLCKEALEFNEFTTITGYGPEDLPSNFTNKFTHILDQSRGGGYWLWKPIILYETFKTINYGDYLVYLDAGCHLNNKGKERFYEYLNMLNNNDLGILSFQMHNQLEKWWTTKEIFKYYNLEPNGEHANSGQFLGGVFILKKNKHSEEYVKKLVSITLTQSELYTDKFNNTNQESWFKDNRHDQSISSLLRKQMGTIIIPKDESFIVPFGGPESLKYPFWASRSKQ